MDYSLDLFFTYVYFMLMILFCYRACCFDFKIYSIYVENIANNGTE